MDEVHCSDNPQDQIEVEIGVTPSNIDDLHSSDSQGDQMEG